MFVQLWREENRRTRRKTLGARREPTTNSTHVRRRARTVGMVGDKHSLRCAIFASPCGYWVGRQREVRRFSQIKRAAENGLVRHESIIFFSSALQSFTQTRRTKEKIVSFAAVIRVVTQRLTTLVTAAKETKEKRGALRSLLYGFAFLRQIPTKPF